MKNIFSLVVIGTLLLASHGGSAAWAYDSLYVFGDSLSDQGNFYAITGGSTPPPEYTDGTTYGRFTNGKNYVDYLSSRLGISSGNSLSVGNNYSYGGARTDSHPQSSYGALSLLDPLRQVQPGEVRRRLHPLQELLVGVAHRFIAPRG